MRRAIIGGSGRLPDILADRSGDAAVLRSPEGVGFGQGHRSVTAFRVERLGELMDDLRKADVDEVVFAGAMRRPPFDPARLDPFTAKAAPRLLSALRDGDDATLRFVLTLFEENGFAIATAQDIAPDLLPEAGVATVRQPGPQDEADARRARLIVEALGAVDVGQGCVVAQGQALAVEAAPGTDWMLRQLQERSAPWRPDPADGKGIFFKAPKAKQDRRVDLPAIGPETVRNVAAAGLAGLVVEKDGVLVLDSDDVLAEAEAAGLFLWVLAPETSCASF